MSETPSNQSPTILFGGGGTGGHIYPAIAIAQALHQQSPSLNFHFACSEKQLDADIISKHNYPYTQLSMQSVPSIRNWTRMSDFYKQYRRSRDTSRELILSHNVKCVVAMGGYCAAPPVVAARQVDTPSILVNLDAVPGKANKWLADKVNDIYTVYPVDTFKKKNAQLTSFPLRQSAIGPSDSTLAKSTFNISPDQRVLLVTGASQGAKTINEMMITLAENDTFKSQLNNWHILHLTGADDLQRVQLTYERAGLPHTCLAFCDQMGHAWAAADLAISRSGAGSVGEVIANHTPTIFLPYPHHKDEHQKKNAQPLADSNAAIILQDLIEPHPNATQIMDPLIDLINNQDKRNTLKQNITKADKGSGADFLAQQVLKHL